MLNDKVSLMKLFKKKKEKKNAVRQLERTACMILFFKHLWSTFPRLDAPKDTKIRMSAEMQQDDGRSYVTLTCSTDCYPPVERFSWYKQAKGQERDVKLSESMIFRVFSDQPGIYYCTAKNEINEIKSGPVTLFVGGECRPVHLSSVEQPNLFARLS